MITYTYKGYNVVFANLQIYGVFILLIKTRNLLRMLTHWGRVTHMWVDKLTIIGSDNGLSPGRRQAIT